MLKPCPHRQAQTDGQLTCAKISGSDREVTAALCAACPAGHIGCSHLRFSLTKVAPSNLLIRWGNGKQELLEAEPPHVEMPRAACAEQSMPIHGVAACQACPIRLPWDVIAPQTIKTRRPAPKPNVDKTAATAMVIDDAPYPPDTSFALTPEGKQMVRQASNILVFRRKSA